LAAGAAERVILVDRNDRRIGTAEKMEAHRKGWLHRAISVFVFSVDGRVLLQRRAPHKYHSPGRWSNTCCTHPRPGESVGHAARRRLREEMGIAAALTHTCAFVYRVALDGDLVEHELDHVFVGRASADPAPNADEVDAWRWCAIPDVVDDVVRHPARYSAWLPHALRALLLHAPPAEIGLDATELEGLSRSLAARARPLSHRRSGTDSRGRSEAAASNRRDRLSKRR
jgi:isopentenyl-diphosphate delta-isomerase